jgi:serine/threonine-protein kinase RsbW
MQCIERNLTVSANTAELQKVRDFVEAAVMDAGFTERDRRLVTLAIDEAVTNILLYADVHKSVETVTVAIDADEVRLKTVIEENATVFDVPDIRNGDMEAYVRREGAYKMGIFLIRKIMDEISYQFKKGFENTLTLVKYR